MNFGVETSFGFSAVSTGGGGGGSGLSVQFAWVVGGNANFVSPTPPVAGAATLTSGALTGKKVIVSRNGLNQSPFNPGNGNSYFTFSGSTVTFVPALVAQEEMEVQA
jgi:hypothetical protein